MRTASMLALLLVVGCQDQSEIQRSTTSSAAAKSSKHHKAKDVSDSVDGAESADAKPKEGNIIVEGGPDDDAKSDDGKDDTRQSVETLAANAGDTKVVEVKYPSLRLNGSGITYCSGDHGPYAVTANIKTNFTAADTASSRNSTVVNCLGDDDCQERVNTPDDALWNAATNKFIRPTKEELDAIKDKKIYDDAFVFAKSGTAVNGHGTWSYIYDLPVPVSPWPADKARYADFTTKTWTAHVTGTYNMDVSVTAKKVSQDDHTVVITMTTTLPIADASGNWDYYKVYPTAWQSTYTINTDKQVIMKIQSVGRHNGAKHCDDQTHTDFTFIACDETVGGTVTPLGCKYSGQ